MKKVNKKAHMSKYWGIIRIITYFDKYLFIYYVSFNKVQGKIIIAEHTPRIKYFIKS